MRLRVEQRIWIASSRVLVLTEGQVRCEQEGVPLTSTLHVAGTTISYGDDGHGEPVVLLHGSGPGASAAGNWAEVVPDLVATGRRVLTPDIVGFGDSGRPRDFPYGPVGWAESIIGFLDALGIEAVHLVGNSMGGRIALNVAARDADRVMTVTVMGVRAPNAAFSAGLGAVRDYDGTREGLRDLFTDFFVVDASLVTKEMVDSRFAAASRPGETEHYRTMFQRPGANDLSLTSEDLGHLRHPVLVIQGREDRVIPMRDGVALVEAIPDCIGAIVPNCGHWVQLERREEFLGFLEQFLARHGAPS